MPFEIRMVDGKHCVFTQGTDKNHGCHPTRAQAVRQLRALYVNVPEARRASMSDNTITVPGTMFFSVSPQTYGAASNTANFAITGESEALVAGAAIPTAPPRDWFFRPEPDEPTPMTYEDSGEVYGHLALNESCHRGFMSGAYTECVKPPRSMTDYAQFHLGEIQTAEGDKVAIGRITYETDHAPLTADVVAASRHYDNTGSVGAYVRATNGRHGIWLSGVLRSDLDPAGLVALRANPLSGDWRSLNHNLELVAALAVPVPGFPIPRAQLALSASGDVVEVTTLILGDALDDMEEEPFTASAEYRLEIQKRRRKRLTL